MSQELQRHPSLYVANIGAHLVKRRDKIDQKLLDYDDGNTKIVIPGIFWAKIL